MNEIGAYAFGIYLFHQLWALVFRWFGLSLLAPSPVVAVPLFALVFFLLALAGLALFFRELKHNLIHPTEGGLRYAVR